VTAIHLKRLGLTGFLGAALLMFAVIHFLSAALPERERIAALSDEVSRFGTAAPSTDPRPGDPGQDLETFYRYFEKSASVSGALTGLHDAVADSGLAFEAAQYRLARDSSLRLARYEVTVPLRGTYAQVRSFVAALLERLPQVALEDVAIKRDSVGAASIEARLRLSIYMALP